MFILLKVNINILVLDLLDQLFDESFCMYLFGTNLFCSILYSNTDLISAFIYK